MDLFGRFRRMDWMITSIMLLLIGIGLLVQYSAGLAQANHFSASPAGRQLVWLCLGIVCYFVIMLLPVRFFYQISWIAYAAAVALLLFVLFFGTGPGGRWISIAGIRFQPSEWAKLAVLCASSRFFADRQTPNKKNINFKLFLIYLVPVLLIIKEPDFGTSIVFIALLFGHLIWSGFDWRKYIWSVVPVAALFAGFSKIILSAYLFFIAFYTLLRKRKRFFSIIILLLSLAAGFLGPWLWNNMQPYQQRRITTFLGINSDPHGSGYQVIQSKVAIGSGGILGKGYLQGTQSQLRFLPEQHTDFILSVLAEEFGFIAVAAVFVLFLSLIFRILTVARLAKSVFAGFLAFGIFTMMSYQLIVNAGMTTGLAPVTGLPVPFLSYGGSSLLVYMICLGLIQILIIERYI